MSENAPIIPWSSKAPQKYVLSVIAIVLGVAIMVTAIAYIANGTGGVVPFLMLAVAPVLTIVYLYSFLFKKWETTE